MISLTAWKLTLTACGGCAMAETLFDNEPAEPITLKIERYAVAWEVATCLPDGLEGDDPEWLIDDDHFYETHEAAEQSMFDWSNSEDRWRVVKVTIDAETFIP